MRIENTLPALKYVGKSPKVSYYFCKKSRYLWSYSPFSILNSQLKISLCILLLATSLFAASYEFDVHYGLGVSELSFNSVPGVAFTIYPIKNFGFSAGLEYSWRGKTKTGAHSGENPIALDNEGDQFILRYSVDKYKEELHGRIMQVPLLFKYSNDFYYSAAGVKIGTAQKAGADISYKGLKTEGYYPDYNLPLSEPFFQGFGEHKDSTFKTNNSTKTLFMLTLESGVKFKLSDFTVLTGVFADYSLNKAFDRTLPPLIERVENKNGASIAGNDTWKSWRPWSVGAMVKLSFSFDLHEQAPEPLPEQPEPPPEKPIKDEVRGHSIVVEADVPPPPIPVPPKPPAPAPVVAEQVFRVPPLPSFLLNKKPNFVFNYPETRTSPSDSLHMALVEQIADTMKANNLQLHCVGYSEKLLSESLAYETALQRSIRIRYALTRFYGVSENRIHVYSQGSKKDGYRRAECFILPPR
ncbi:MAG: hypothetical protein LBU89_03850 [Fibromonadaceae bacterium]|nr:hypothetical protein [Fibromonadaceae bacterium]